MKWDEERQRKVLNAAVSSIVTSEMIRAATFAVATGFCGSLSRRTSSRHDVRQPFVLGRIFGVLQFCGTSALRVTGPQNACLALANLQLLHRELNCEGDEKPIWQQRIPKMETGVPSVPQFRLT